MLSRFFRFVLVMCALLPAQAQEPQKTVQKKFEPETFYMVLMRRAEHYDASKASAFVGKQREHWNALVNNGDLVASGPVTVVKDKLAAVMIFRAPDPATAEAFMESDPFVQQHLWTGEVHPWMTQKGVLAPAKSVDPKEDYFLGFLRRGAKFTNEESPERQKIQEGHMANIRRLADMGKLAAAGPFMDDGDLRGIFVFKTATIAEAEELTNTDPAVQAGRLRIDLYPWRVPEGSFVPLK